MRSSCGWTALDIDFIRTLEVTHLPMQNCHSMLSATDHKQTEMTVWHVQAQDERPTWEKLHSDYQIKVDTAGNYSVLVPTQSPTWYNCLWDILSSTLYECKVGVSYFYPHIQFSMMCQAVIQENAGDSKTFGLAIICYRTEKKRHNSLCGNNIVGGSLKPKMVRPGTIQVRLVSRDFEADTFHGEDRCLTKTEPDFRGRDFEKQFACRFKGSPVRKGVFGKVYVEHVRGETIQTLFEFNLTRDGDETKRTDTAYTDKTDGWSILAVKELAGMLHITDGDNWKTFAKHLGFTDREIKAKLATEGDHFGSMLTAYQSRGGTPEEFVQALYQVSRKLRMEDQEIEDADADGYNLRSLGQQANRLTDDEEVEALNLSQASTVLVTSSSLPLTPPPTPRKLKRSSSDQSRSPSKRLRRRLSDDTSTVILSDQDHSECDDELTNLVLWQVSAHVHHKWKSLGRNLDIPEDELLCIEHAYRELRECAYQALLKWKDMFPQHFRYGVLYAALCETGLNSAAYKYCTVSG